MVSRYDKLFVSQLPHLKKTWKTVSAPLMGDKFPFMDSLIPRFWQGLASTNIVLSICVCGQSARRLIKIFFCDSYANGRH
jgi:hypothetical protein